MGLFAIGGRRRNPATRTPFGAEDSAGDVQFPRGFEAVGEALLAEECPLAACDAVGREMALDGASVPEALSGLQATWGLARGEEPPFDVVRALVVAWSETALSGFNQISCEDPMTGLASMAHVRSVVAGAYRQHRLGAPHPQESHAIVVVDLPPRFGPEQGDPLLRAMRIARTGEAVRTVFAGGESIARAGADRLLVVTSRCPRLGSRVRLVRRLVEGVVGGRHAPRVWIEGLPSTETASGHLLDELARS